MSTRQESIFRPRKTQLAPSSNDSSISVEPNIGGEKGVVELTKNKKYCVSRLPAFPSALERAGDGNVWNGYTDYKSKHALVVNENGVYVWYYNSTDTSPLSVQFPLDNEETGLLPLAILTQPSSGVSNDPGLVMIDSNNGLVKFYESVQHAPAIGLINNNSLELRVPLNTKNEEYISLAEDVEPAGIAIATSWKRCFLIGLRDFEGKPNLTCKELLDPAAQGGLLSSIFGKYHRRQEKADDEIACIRSRHETKRGPIQELIIQESGGNFHLIPCRTVGTTGATYLDYKKGFKYNLAPYVENSIDGYLPGTQLQVRFLDMWPLYAEEVSNVYLAMCFVDTCNDDRNLILVIMKIDRFDVRFYGSRKLNCYNRKADTNEAKPKLYIPHPGLTAFIVIGSSVILTSIDISQIKEGGMMRFYQPRWEDLVKFKSSVDIIGLGYEDRSDDSNASVVLLTSNVGVLRVEKFPESTEANTSFHEDTSPVQFAKSHIEQSIFYENSAAIDFDVHDNLSNEVVIEATRKVLSEIMDSSSPYLPEFLASLMDFQEFKAQLFRALIHCIKRNCIGVADEVIPNIVECLEKTEVSIHMWHFANGEAGKSNRLVDVLRKVIAETVPTIAEDENMIRRYFSQHIFTINQVFTKLITVLLSSHFSLFHIVHLIVKTMSEGVYANEVEFICGKISRPRRHWIFETDLLLNIAEVYSQVYCNNEDYEYVLTQEERSNMVHLCSVLYYFVNSAIQFMETESGTTEQLKGYRKWYKLHKSQWIKALVRFGCQDSAIEITERYSDFFSLAQILENERSTIRDNKGETSQEYANLIEVYSFYFNKFGYNFASSLFDLYLKNGDIHSILGAIDGHNAFVTRYFQENYKLTSEISWIRDLLDGNYIDASKTLVYSAATKLDDLQENREFKYSLAKLAAVSASSQSATGDSALAPELLSESESNLIPIRVQNNLYEQVMELVAGNTTRLVEFFVQNFINDKVAAERSLQIIEPFYESFVLNKPLLHGNLITLLTLLKPALHFQLCFALALKVAAGLQNEAQYKQWTRIIWLRLLALADDWPHLLNDADSSDLLTKEKIHNSVIYKTILALGSDSLLLDELFLLLSHVHLDSKPLHQSPPEDLLDASCILTIRSYASLDLLSWVKAIRQEAVLYKARTA